MKTMRHGSARILMVAQVPEAELHIGNDSGVGSTTMMIMLALMFVVMAMVFMFVFMFVVVGWRQHRRQQSSPRMGGRYNTQENRTNALAHRPFLRDQLDVRHPWRAI
jgi:uncharacterized membrane protein